ncbi:Eco57I restriction-modification methylase domain-containing protein [Secundilactobacillus similis]|uniref:Eco57I restriction-modification methylase domain-containing protein n=1 Tax=Secundilactobacillus similis TaxID=414682 RepID=UPI00138F0822
MHLAIDLLKDQGILGFITTNYWVTATYADKLREDLRERTNLLSFYNFNELKFLALPRVSII